MESILAKDVGRRKVLKGLGILSLMPLCPEIMAMPINRPPYKYSFKYSDFKATRSTCPMECLHCNLTAYTYKDQLIKVEATPGFNVKGCMRGLSRTKWVYHKDRLTTPLLRVGEKGKGEFKPISWDEALDLIEEKIRKTIAEDGNKGMLLNVHSGSMDSIKNVMGVFFFNYLGGATFQAGSLCCSAIGAAMIPMLGFRYADTRDTIADSRYLLCWANNPAVTMHAYWKDFNQARKNGARLVVIDPRYSETAAKADEWIQINPGTDTALALGMMKVIIDENRIDEKFLRNKTGAVYLISPDDSLARSNSSDQNSYQVYDLISQSYVRHDTPDIKPALFQTELPADTAFITVFEKVKREAQEWTVERVTEETDVPIETIYRLARDYSSIQPAMIVQNMSGAQRTEFGAYVAGSQFYLALLTGNIGKKGNGICDAGGATQMAKFGLPVPFPKNVQRIPKIPMAGTAKAIVNETPHAIKFWWQMTVSTMTQMPNTNEVKRAFEKVPFVVVSDNLMTSSALYADLVLPVTTVFEDVSLMAGTRSHYVQLMEKAVEPPGEAKPDYWIFARLAERFGFGEVFNQPIEHYIENVLEGSGITLEQLRKGPVKPAKHPWVPFKDGEFRTPTGKAHFFVEEWQKKSYSPVIKYYQVKESPKGNPKLAEKYPLMAVQRKLARSVHSSHGTNEWILEIQRNKPVVQIHPDDAAKRNIKNGDWAIAFNNRGEHRAIAEVTAFIKKGVVCLDNGWWEQQGGSSSHVTSDAIEPLGNGHCCNSTLVDVRAEV